ncbi:C-terminal binding protein [Halomarina pelagica]|uniref:C-terminal binding protein n=1 Tax=Halomarina pelagica TaxID=2961599 RepID=UPI0020C4D510|nr:C-terminal binding protein [Halomarina sp. BND7]
MIEYTVVATDQRYGEFSVEREILGDVAEIRRLDEDGVSLADADALINHVDVVSAADVDRLERCRVIARYGIGVDNIDVEAATERGIYVANVPDYCTEEVPTHAIALILALDRQLKQYGTGMAAGEWKTDRAAEIRRFSEETVSVVGFGRLGRGVGDRAAALGATVLAADPYLGPDDVADHDAELVSFEEAVERADYLSVHSPLTPETEGMIDADVFARMKGTASLINVARGPVVDEAALIEALSAGEIAGAGLDVFETEPPAVDNPLRDHPRVVATPHQAWYSEESERECREGVARAIRQALEGERPETAVNDP